WPRAGATFPSHDHPMQLAPVCFLHDRWQLHLAQQRLHRKKTDCSRNLEENLDSLVGALLILHARANPDVLKQPLEDLRPGLHSLMANLIDAGVLGSLKKESIRSG